MLDLRLQSEPKTMKYFTTFPLHYSTVLTTFLFLLHFTTSSNIDTTFPIFFSPPTSSSPSSPSRQSLPSSLPKSSSHFGYSLASFTDSNQREISIFVGAPRASSSKYNVSETGSIFMCNKVNLEEPSETNYCREIDVQPYSHKIQRPDGNGLSDWNKYVNPSMNTNMFLGGSISLSPSNRSQVGSFCAHGWIDEQIMSTPTDKYAYHVLNPSGRCWLFNPRNGSVEQPIFPFIRYSEQFKNRGSSSTYYYSHASGGMSSTFSPDGSHLYMGAPGFHQWRGSFASYKVSPPFLGSLTVNEGVSSLNGIPSESYAGYSIISGNFGSRDGTVDVILGAPRDNSTGRIWRIRGTNMQPIFSGSRFGEYFGSSLLAADINGDSFDDLLVGAPFYSPSRRQKGDRGRVYVYLNNRLSGFYTRPIILSGLRSLTAGNGSPGARFGSTMASLGDINMDGVTDFAVGAPYEEQSGAVYIYHGNRGDGGFMRDEYAQRIVGKQLRSDLYGFGQGISSTTIDIDGNGYNDLLVGSYLSDQVVLLRTKPIVRSVKLTHKFGVERIDLSLKQCSDLRGNKAACFSFRYTINRETGIRETRIRGRRIEYGRLLVTLTADSRYPSPIDARAYFDESKEPVLRRMIEPSSNQDPKPTIEGTIIVRNDLSDKLSPLTVKFSYNATLAEDVKKQPFCDYCAVYADPFNSWENEVPFATGCDGKTCQATLSHRTVLLRPSSIPSTVTGPTVNGSTDASPDSVLELSSGNETRLSFHSVVTNTGESSYNTRMTVSVTSISKANIVLLDRNCSESKIQESLSSLVIECDIGNPIQSGSTSIVSLLFNVEKLDLESRNMVFNVSISSSSELTADSDTFSSIQLRIKRFASINVDGHQKSQSFYSEEEREDIKEDHIGDNVVIPFSMTGSVSKINTSAVNGVVTTIKIPVSLQDFVDEENGLISSEEKPESEEEVRERGTKETGTENTWTGNHIPFLFKPQFTSTSLVNILCDTSPLNVLPQLPIEPGSESGPKTASLVSSDQVDNPFTNPLTNPLSNPLTNGTTLRRRSRRGNKRGKSLNLHNHPLSTSLNDRKLRLDCSSEHVKCLEVVCATGPFGSKTRTVASFDFTSALNLSVIRSDFGTNYTSIELFIQVEATITDEVDTDDGTTRSVTRLVATFQKQPKIESLQTWVFLLSSGAGILILIVVIICLVSFGFFKRKTREDFQRELEAEEEKLIQEIHASQQIVQNQQIVSQEQFDHENSERSYSFI